MEPSTKKIKLLYIVESFECGGVEEFVKNLATTLCTHRYDVSILYIGTRPTTLSAYAERKGVQVYTTGYNSRYNLLNILYYIRFMRKHTFDVVHVNHLFPQMYVAVASLCIPGHTQFITTEHASFNKKRKVPLFKYIDTLFYRRYTKVISVSQSVRDNLTQWLPIRDTSRFEYIYNGIDIDRFSTATAIDRSEFGYKSGDILLLSIGRMVYGKDFKTILDSLKELPSHYKLLIVGDGPLLDENKAYATSLALGEDRVKFTGRRSDIHNLMKTCDIYIASTYFEGFPITVLEAMASGLPVIGTDIPPIFEALGKTEYLFPIHDHEQLTQRIQSLSQADKAYFSERRNMFSQSAMIRDYERVYNSVLNK